MDPTAAIQQAIEKNVLAVAQAVEDKLDNEINKLDRLDEDDLEVIRERRLAEMKRAAAKKREWQSQGHGDYKEIHVEKDFFGEMKTSERVVCHFYRENWPCKVVDKHLQILAKSHLETKFVKLNAEKSPFLTERLRIVVLPTLALIKNGKAEDYVVGFDELGGTDDFSTDVLEDRLARSGIIFQDGASADGSGRRQGARTEPKRNLRQSSGNRSDSDED